MQFISVLCTLLLPACNPPANPPRPGSAGTASPIPVNRSQASPGLDVEITGDAALRLSLIP